MKKGLANNFDFLRLLFALLVVVSHSFPITGDGNEWLASITGGKLTLGTLSVQCFFIISGYLIFQSFQRSKNAVDYYWKRILRIYPALIVVLFLTVMLGPFVYEGLVGYVKNPDIWTYIPHNLGLFHQQGRIEGIFEGNTMKVINGSLWSIRYEIFMYIFISLLFFIRKIPNGVLAAIAISFVALFTGNIFYVMKAGFHPLIHNIFGLGPFFLAGSLLAAVNINGFRHKKVLMAISFLLLLVTFGFDIFIYTNYILLPIVIILFGLTPIAYICNIAKKMGDISYGVYIYAFPVQQTLVYYFKLNYLQLIFTAIIISCALAYCSWHLIEKRALRFKSIHPKLIFCPQLSWLIEK